MNFGGWYLCIHVHNTFLHDYNCYSFQRLKEQLRQQHVNNQFGGSNNNIISRAMTEAVDMVTSQHNGLPSQLHSHSQPQAQQSQDHKPEVAEEDYQHEQKRVGLVYFTRCNVSSKSYFKLKQVNFVLSKTVMSTVCVNIHVKLHVPNYI